MFITIIYIDWNWNIDHFNDFLRFDICSNRYYITIAQRNFNFHSLLLLYSFEQLEWVLCSKILQNVLRNLMANVFNANFNDIPNLYLCHGFIHKFGKLVRIIIWSSSISNTYSYTFLLFYAFCS